MASVALLLVAHGHGSSIATPLTLYAVVLAVIAGGIGIWLKVGRRRQD